MRPELALEGDGVVGQTVEVDILPREQQRIRGSGSVPEAVSGRRDAEMGLEWSKEVDWITVGQQTGCGRSIGPAEGEGATAGDVESIHQIGAEEKAPVGRRPACRVADACGAGRQPEGIFGDPVTAPALIGDVWHGVSVE